MGGAPGPPAWPAARTCPLNALLYSGVPVVAWSRAGPGPAAAALSALFDQAPLGSLPDRVRRARLEAADDDHPGRHLTLLWDDPDRLPPDLDPRNALRPPD